MARGNERSGVYIENADGTERRLLLDSAFPLSPMYRGRIVVEKRPTDSSYAPHLYVAVPSSAQYYEIAEGPNVRKTATLVPGGDHVVWFEPDPNRMVGQLWVARNDGSERRLLTSKASWETDVVRGSPDGKWIAYNEWPTGLCISALSHSETRVLGEIAEHGVAWSPTSRQVLVGGGRLYTIQPDGSISSTLPEQVIYRPDWDLKSSRIVGYHGDYFPMKLVIVEPNGLMRVLLEPVESFDDIDESPRWSPSGERLLFKVRWGQYRLLTFATTSVREFSNKPEWSYD